MNGGDIRRKDSGADSEPIERMAREKILVGRCVAPISDPNAERGDANEVNGNYCNVDGRHVHR
jgi:hypothetical protein